MLTPLMWIETVWFTSAVVIDLDRSENVKKSEPFASPSGHPCRPKLLQRRKQWQKQRRRPKPRPRLRRCQKPRQRPRRKPSQKPRQRRKPRRRPRAQWFQSARSDIFWHVLPQFVQATCKVDPIWHSCPPSAALRRIMDILYVLRSIKINQ